MVRPISCLLVPLFCYLSTLAQEAVQPFSKDADTICREIHLSSKRVLKANKILLQWKATGNTNFYIVERSINEKEFDVIGVIKSSVTTGDFEFMDEKPSASSNHYRIKIQEKDETNRYSEIISAGVSDSVFCKFYPNPVDKLLILRSDYTPDVKITDIIGNTRIAQRLKPGLQVLDVSFLEKNIYFITFSHRGSNQFITKKLIKN
jgi:hypothetical protein